MTSKGCGCMVMPGWFPSVEGRGQPAGTLNVKFCRKFDKNRNSSILANGSPKHVLGPTNTICFILIWACKCAVISYIISHINHFTICFHLHSQLYLKTYNRVTIMFINTSKVSC